MRKFRWAIIATFLVSVLAPVMALAAEVDMPLDAFLGSVLEFVKGFGGMPWTLKVAGIVALIVSTAKVSILRILWDKMGKFKVIVAPVLGLVGGLFAVQPFNAAGVMAYVFAGAGAIVLHELLDGIKSMPGIKPVAVKVIDFLKGILKAPVAK